MISSFKKWQKLADNTLLLSSGTKEYVKELRANNDLAPAHPKLQPALLPLKREIIAFQERFELWGKEFDEEAKLWTYFEEHLLCCIRMWLHGLKLLLSIWGLIIENKSLPWPKMNTLGLSDLMEDLETHTRHMRIACLIVSRITMDEEDVAMEGTADGTEE